MKFKIWLETYKFIGQCDNLRMCGNEDKWQQMMSQKQPVSKKEFLANCDISELLDNPNETIDDFITDPQAKFYRSVWGSNPCYFFQKYGFEFIFSV